LSGYNRRAMRLGIFRGLKDRLDRMLGRGIVDEQLFDDLEDALTSADVPVRVVDSILESLRERVRADRLRDAEDVRRALKEEIAERLRDARSQLRRAETAPTVLLFFGVNGAGKTTTIAKVAQMLMERGERVILAAADTFRAAAIDQLEIWASRVGAEIVRAQPGGDPAAVVFDAITAAKARGIGYVLADTAGRQHTKTSLMSELEKIGRVTEKALGRKADELLLVLDGNTGQNAIRQAEEFARVMGVTGVVVTKLDGTPRGGAVLGIKQSLGIPIKFIGIGEKPSDLKPFDADEFAEALMES